MLRTTLAALVASLMLATVGQAATTIPAKITALFAAQASHSKGAWQVTCTPAGASYRCVFYRPATMGLTTKITVAGKVVEAEVRGGTSLTRASACGYTVRHLGGNLTVGLIETVNTCAPGWATRVHMP